MASKSSKITTLQSALPEQSLQQIANCLGYFVIHSEEFKGKTKNDLIPVLAGLSFDRNAIASILQTTPENVSVRLSQLKSQPSKKSSTKNETQTAESDA
jgi:hypothetical protein